MVKTQATEDIIDLSTETFLNFEGNRGSAYIFKADEKIFMRFHTAVY
jgi:hypothetical protein